MKTSTVESADGVAIEYDVAGSGLPALILVHGWGCDRHLWDETVALFAESHRLVTLDLGGHGRSGRNRNDWTMASFGADVAAVARAVAAPRIVLVGHSMGGAVVLEAARALPDRVQGILLVDTLTDVSQRMPQDEIDGYIAHLAQDYRANVAAMVRQHLFRPTTDPELVERITSSIAGGSPEIMLGALRRSWEYDGAAGFAAVSVPIRAINTDLYPTNIEVNRRHAPGYDAVVMKGLAHYPMLEDPASFHARLAETLAVVRQLTER